MSTIQADSVVTLAYVLRNTQGEIIDQAGPDDRFEYLHGHGNIIPGLESALVGQAAGAKLTVEVPPEQGYGSYDPDLEIVFERSELPKGMKVGEGDRLQVRIGEAWRVMTVEKIEGEKIAMNGNHELAGQTLRFEVEVVAVRPATDEEIGHGHVHGPHGHAH